MIGLWRVILAVALLGAWELFGRFVDSSWTSEPSMIAVRLVAIIQDTLPNDIFVTLSEIVLGFMIGLPTGVLMGMWLGRSPVMASLLRPLIVALNSVPYVALAPLLIMWFGLGIEPKIALVTLVVFFLIFFNTFAGAMAVDQDWIATLQVMGATRREQFQKVIVPACFTWILSGIKSALPYSLIAATVGEMMLARAGVGHFITNAAAQFDITGIYTGLLILMVLGGLVNMLATRLETWLLHWRPSAG